MIRHVLLAVSFLVSTTHLARAAPVAPSASPFDPIPAPETPALETTSYRQITLAVDGISVGLFLAGALAEGENGRDNAVSEGLMTAGMLGATFGAPLVHGLRGHGGRLVGSLGLRLGLTSLGMLAAVAARSDCDVPTNDGQGLLDPDFLCELDYVGYGYLAGLVTAILIDAAYLTSETREVPRWSPQVSASHDGARVGVAWTW